MISIQINKNSKKNRIRNQTNKRKKQTNRKKEKIQANQKIKM